MIKSVDSNFFVIIQARINSTRLPKKVLLELCGMSVLEFMIKRLNEFKDKIIIATTNDGSEEPIISLCQKNKINYFRGSEENLLERFTQAAISFGAQENDIIIRLTSDCPLICIEPIKEGLVIFSNSDFDYYSNCIQRSYPRGLDFEMVRFYRLKEAYMNATNKRDKEHVMTYFYHTNKDRFKLGNLMLHKDYSNFRLTLDEALDYEAIKETMRLLNCKIDFSLSELLNLLDNHPKIASINSSVKQKSL